MIPSRLQLSLRWSKRRRPGMRRPSFRPASHLPSGLTSCSSVAPRSVRTLPLSLEAFRSIEGFELRVVGQHKASPVHDARRDQSGVRWLGFIGEEELVDLYRHATALVFPSRYEGFGLPVLEAMARRTPVIASNSSSIPEVAQGAAILVDPDDVQGLSEAMRRVCTEPALRAELIERGAEVVSGFSWDETARATVAAYEELSAVR